MGEQSLFSPDTFDILNLTDAQKQEMQKIKKELEPEFDKNLDVIASGVTVHGYFSSSVGDLLP
jgi:hypothetical protein